MAFNGTVASSSRGGPRTVSSHHSDPFQGGTYQYGAYGSGMPEMRDPAQVRAARASRTGSSSGSIFKEELGMGSPNTASVFADPLPSPDSRRMSTFGSDHRPMSYTTDPRRTSAYGGDARSSAYGPPADKYHPAIAATDPLLGSSMTNSPPTSFPLPRSESPTSFSPPNARRTSSSSVASSSYPYAYPPPPVTTTLPRKRSSGGSTSPLPPSPLPPGASPALGPMARTSFSVEEKFKVRNLSTATFDPMETDRERKRRDSYVLPTLLVKGDGDLRSLDNGSRVDLKPFMSEDEGEYPSSLRKGRS